MKAPARGRFALAAAVVLLGAAAPLRAAPVVRCVGDNTAFGNALAEAQLHAVDIRLVQGSYDFADTAWHGLIGSTPPKTVPVQGGTLLRGGYTAACASRHIAVGASGNTTIIDSAIVDTSVYDGAQPTGDLTIEGVTFKVRNALYIKAGDAFDVPLRRGSQLRVHRNAFVGTSLGGVRVLFGSSGDSLSRIRLSENLVAANTNNTSAMLVRAYAGGPSVEIINNTVVSNPGSQSTGITLANDDPGGYSRYYLYNNIVYGQGYADVYALTPNVYLYNNTIGSYNGPTPLYETATYSGDPQLDANYRPIKSPVSPSIEAGTNWVVGGLPALDLDGAPRVNNNFVDRGAYESDKVFGITQVVTNTADSTAPGTLRHAIEYVNANGGGMIEFDIAGGCGPHVISIGSDLPALTNPTTISGWSQTGAGVNELDEGFAGPVCIILEAANSLVTRGLQSAPGAVRSNLTVRGLAFSGFSTAAIDLRDSIEHVVIGNVFGGAVGGHALIANNNDIRIEASTYDNTIGAEDVAGRNLINGASGSGIALFGNSSVNTVIGNYIGVGWSAGAYNDVGNGAAGAYVEGGNNIVTRNLIGYNGQEGVLLINSTGSYNLVEHNFIGADADDTPVANSGPGVKFSGAAGNAPTGNTLQFNAIAHNQNQGVRVDIGQQNQIHANSIHNNGGIGIDLSNDGVSPNDSDGGLQPTDLANRLQNFPLLGGGVGGSAAGTADGTLTTTPGYYTIDLYNAPGCDPSGFGEGWHWVGSLQVQVPTPPVGTQGTASFSVPIAAEGPGIGLDEGSTLTATATDNDNNTSEFSACATYHHDALFASGFE